MEQQEFISAMRVFNRFYARMLGVFDKYVLNTNYPLVEARIIGEIGRNADCTANSIAAYLEIDRSYMARIIARFEKQMLLTKEISPTDSRKKILRLTATGQMLYMEFEQKSDEKIQTMLRNIDKDDLAKLQQSMNDIHCILCKGENQNRRH